MPEHYSFEYCVLRVVPFVERQEFLNVGVVLHCGECNYLAAKLDFDLQRLSVFSPQCDLRSVRMQLDGIMRICTDDKTARYFSEASKSERFNWIAAVSSTIIQPAPVHCGLCDNPEQALSELYESMVEGNPD